LRTPTSNIKDTLSKLPPESYKDIVTKYRDSFSAFEGKDFKSEVQIKIGSFESDLRKIQVSLIKLCK